MSDDILHILSFKMSFQEDTYLKMQVPLSEHVLLIEHIHQCEGIYRSLFQIPTW